MKCPLFLNSRRIPDAPAVRWGSRSLTWAALEEYVQGTALHLKEIGVRPDTRLASLSANNVESLIIFLAAWRIGACVLPLNLRLPYDLREKILKQFDPKYLFISIGHQHEHRHFRRFLQSAVISPERSGREPVENGHVNRDIDPETVIMVLLTSGSSGYPKSVRLTYGQMYFNALGANEKIPFTPGNSWLLALPLWHVSGTAILFRSLLGGGAVVIPGETALSDSIPRYLPTHVSLVPLQLKKLLTEPALINTLKEMTAILLGGGPIPLSLAVQSAQAGLPLFLTYGMTETASQIATSHFSPAPIPRMAVLPHREVTLTDQGEILVRGEVVFNGYLWGGTAENFTTDGWFRTGDIGSLTAEGLAIHGRKDNMFVCGGENVHPENIERALAENPEIEAACAIAIDDPFYGARPAVFVKFQAGRTLTAAELSAFLRARLPVYEVPSRFFEWIPGMPATKFSRQVFQQCPAPAEIL